MLETIAVLAQNPTFLKLQRLLQSSDRKNIADILNSIDQLQDLLDELWTQSLPGGSALETMESLLSAITRHFVTTVKQLLPPEKLWNLSEERAGSGDETMENAAQILTQWLDIVKFLTKHHWPIAHSEWKRTSVNETLPLLDKFVQRIRQIQQVRNVHLKILQLLGPAQHLQYNLRHDLSDIFDANAVFEFESKLFQQCLDEYFKSLLPLQSQLTQMLSKKTALTSPLSFDFISQLYYYVDFFHIAAVKQELSGERRQAFKVAESFLETVSQEYQAHSSKDFDFLHVNLANVVVWCRRVKSQLTSIYSWSLAVFDDFPETSRFQENLKKTLSQVTEFEKQVVADWQAELLKRIQSRDPEFVLQISGKLMEIEPKQGKLIVNFHSSLVDLLTTARNITALGHTLPQPIQALVSEANAIYPHAIKLKQIAHFYNYVDRQIIVSQQPMLLDHALAFDSIIKETKLKLTGQNGMTLFKDATSITSFVAKLQGATDQLISANRTLASHHEQLISAMKKLAGIDLLRNASKWKEILGESRNFMAEVQAQGNYENAQIVPWINHLDHQLYKVLQFQWLRGIAELSKISMDHDDRLETSAVAFEYEVELVVRNGVLGFKPTIEDLRSKLYRDIKKFLTIPAVFRGVSLSLSTLNFAYIVEANSAQIAQVYLETEKAIRKLQKFLDNFSEWEALFSVSDVETHLKQALTRTSDWEPNFFFIKTKSKDLELQMTTQKVSCFEVSLLPWKSAIDSVLQKWFDGLVSTLRSAITASLENVEKFIGAGSEVLTRKASTIQEYGNLMAEQRNIRQQFEALKPEMDDVNEKYRLLRHVASAAITIDLMNPQKRWDKFQLILEGHELMMKDQVETIKAAQKERMSAYAGELDVFEAKIVSFKNSLDSNAAGVSEESFALIDELATKLELLKKRGSEFEFECGMFNMEVPKFSALTAVSELFEKEFSVWGEYRQFWTEASPYLKQEWVSFKNRLPQLFEFRDKWNGIVATKLAANATTKVGPGVLKIQHEVESLTHLLSNAKFLRGDNWSSEHWLELLRLLEITLVPGTMPENVLLQDLLAVSGKLSLKLDAITALNARAQAEIRIREALLEVDTWGATCSFQMVAYQGRNPMLIKNWSDIMSQISDHTSVIGSIKDAAAAKRYIDRISIWETRLLDLESALTFLLQVQRRWTYLYPIFTSESFKAFSVESGRFQRTNGDFLNIMSFVANDARVTSLLNYKNVVATLKELMDNLEKSQKALSDFLTGKRDEFPRFYFIGDDDLLEILGQSETPQVIQNHLRKLFSGVGKVEFDDKVKSIVSIVSAEGERVELVKPVAISNRPEIWLQSLDKQIRLTLQALLEKCASGQAQLEKFPEQIVVLAMHVNFTKAVETVLAQDANWSKLISDYTNMLNAFTSYSLENIAIERRKEMESKVKGAILQAIYFLDILKKCQKEKCASVHDWIWNQQLRVYATPNRECKIRCVDTEFSYSFEYQGNVSRLVHTPLTQKCYLTLTQAMANGYGGNPYGPAGTGKTESVKSLGYVFGRQVLVFNCDEGIDHKSMSRIFTGIVKCGAWGCFDEFNRLEDSVLSAVSLQIQAIMLAVKSKASNVELNGTGVEIDPNTAIFVTLNPAGKGYGGRQKLPDNLKQLFRPIAMTVPDEQMITSLLLLSEGFRNSEEIGGKVVVVFQTARQLLSKQHHYDWGLRALKSVLSLAGRLLRLQQKSDSNETEVIIDAIVSINMSKLTPSDKVLFSALLQDTFPGISVDEIAEERFLKNIDLAYAKFGLHSSKSQISRVLQFQKAMDQRIGIGILGPPSSGKSTIWKLFVEASALSGKPIQTVIVNPKAVDRQVLLGYMDFNTREWNDGILTKTCRQIANSEDYYFIIFDGDVDPNWIEALNSVLDDNRLLTMPNGERIQFGQNVNFIFETTNLKFASPATISRVSLLSLSEDELGLGNVVEAWINQQEPERRKSLEAYLKPVTSCFQLAFAETLHGAHVAQTILSELANAPVEDFFTEFFRLLLAHVDESRMQDMLQKLCALSKTKISMEDLFSAQSSADETHSIVETTGLRRASYSLKLALKSGHNSIVFGGPNCGKTTLVDFSAGSFDLVKITCNAFTGVGEVQEPMARYTVISSLPTHKILRPKSGKRLVVFLHRVDLVMTDKYQSSTMHSFLHQVSAYNGYYDHDLSWVLLENVTFVCSAVEISVSLQRVFSRMRPVLVSESAVQINAIASSLVSGYFSRFPGVPPPLAKSLKDFMVEAFAKSYEATRDFVFPVTLRHLKRILETISENVALMDVKSDLAPLVYQSCRSEFSDSLSQDKKATLVDTIINQLASKFLGALEPSLFLPRKVSSDKFALFKSSRPDTLAHVSTSISQFRRDVNDTEIVCFDESLDYFVRLFQLLSSKTQLISLIGQSGCGRRKSCEIVCHSLGHTFVSLPFARSDPKKQLQGVLKTIYQAVATTQDHFVLFAEDNNFKLSLVLQAVHSLVEGSVPSVFARDELDLMISPLKDDLETSGLGITLYAYFIQKLKQQLKVVLSLDQNRQDFTQFCKANPSLLTRNVVWLPSWKRESFVSLIKTWLPPSVIPEKSCTRLASLLLDIAQHHSGTSRMIYQTCLLAKDFFTRRNAMIQKKSSFYVGGLKKLEEVAAEVAVLNEKAVASSRILAEKQKAADEALTMITESMSKASESKSAMENLKRSLQSEEGKILQSKSVVEAQLKDVEPLIRAARDSVGQIKSEHLSEIRSLRAPPPVIRDILEATLRLMGIFDMSWNNMKTFLGKRTVKEEILSFDARNISVGIRNSVQELIRERPESFDEQTVKRASAAVGPLAIWVKANIEYSLVLEKIKPLEAELASLESTLANSQQKVAEYGTGLVQLDAKVLELRNDFAVKTRETETVNISLSEAKEAIKAAESLLGSLTAEKERWSAMSTQLSQMTELNEETSVVSASAITYLSKHTSLPRQKLKETWKKKFGLNAEISPEKYLMEEHEALAVTSQGLPSNAISVENAAMFLNCGNIPLVLDPTGQVVAWFKTRIPKAEFVSIKDAAFMKSLELALRFGKYLIITDVDEIDPILLPILRRDVVTQGTRVLLPLSDKIIELDESFRMVLVSAGYTCSQDLCSLFTEINFSVTVDGLADQILSRTVNHEIPDLETKRILLAQDKRTLEEKLTVLEAKLLEELSSSKEDILKNTKLMNSLADLKSQSQEAENALLQSKQLEQSFERERGRYSEFAFLASSLFFALSNAHALNPMYRFSLQEFFAWLDAVLKEPQLDKAADRIAHLKTSLTCMVFKHSAAAMLKEDVPAFGLYLARQVLSKSITDREWDVFLGKFPASDAYTGDYSWVSQAQLGGFKALLAALPVLSSKTSFENSAYWKEWIASEKPENFADNIAKKLSIFEKALIVQHLRPDRFIAAVTASLESIFGNSDTRVAFMDTTRPVLFIVTPGSDPSLEIRQQAAQSNKDILEISSGHGLKDEFPNITKALSEGKWVILQNIHLASEALPALAVLLAQSAESRIFLTSEETTKLPTQLLNTCSKFVAESPAGMKRNILGSIMSVSKSPVPSSLKSLAVWFHAIVQERRAFLPQGWLKFYEFSQSDFSAMVQLLQSLAAQKLRPETINWPCLNGILLSALYGGKIDNEMDERIFQIYLDRFFKRGVLETNQVPFTEISPIPVNESQLLQRAQDLPDVDSPSNFGLAQNIQSSVVATKISRLCFKLRQLDSGSSVGSSKNTDFHQTLTAVQTCFKNNLAGLSPSGVKPSSDPLNSFFLREREVFLSIVTRIRRDLEQISDVHALAPDIIAQKTPESWNVLEDGSASIIPFMLDIAARFKYVDGMLQSFKSPIAMSMLANPDTIFSVYRQICARNLKVPFDTLQLVMKVSEQQSDSLGLAGFTCQGFTWQGAPAAITSRDAAAINAMPTMQLSWTIKNSAANDQEISLIPVYSNSRREKLVFKLPFQGLTEDLILAGSCLLLRH